MNESRATRHQREARRARSAATVFALASVAILALTPLGGLLATWAESVVQTWPAGLRDLAALFLFVLVIAAGCEGILLAIAIVTRPRREAREGRSVLGGHLFAAALFVPAVMWAALSVQVAIWFVPSVWWLVAGVLVASAMVVALQVAPGFLVKASRATPVERPALVERLGELARRVRVEILSIDVVPPETALTSTALVAGVGGSRRVFISGELLRDWSDGEIAIVVAHELAHHANHDLWRTLAADAVLLSAGFAVSQMLGLAEGGALVTLPRIALVAGLVFLAATPIRYAISRRQERNADAFALKLTGGVEEFRAAIRRLAARHLAEERPSRLTRWFYHRHPTVAERLAFAEEFSRNATSRTQSTGRAFPSGSAHPPTASSGSRIRPPAPRGN